MRRIIIAVAVVLLLVVGTYIFVKSGKKANAPEQQATPAAQGTAAPAKAPGKQGTVQKVIKSTAAPSADIKKDLQAKFKSFKETKGEGYSLITYKGKKGENGVELVVGGVELPLEQGEGKMLVNVNTDGKLSSLPLAGKDITGMGLPNIVIEKKMEGEKCCYEYYIYEVGKELKKIGEFTGLYDALKFKDLDGDGKDEVLGRDWMFKRWWASIDKDIAPDVIWRYKNGEYQLASALMKKNPPMQEEMDDALSRMNNSDTYMSDVWKYMLDLIYTGNGDLAWKFFDKIEWRGEQKIGSKEEFLEAFKEQLTTSPFWEGLRELNDWPEDITKEDERNKPNLEE